jgi:predicted transcriptional regulator
MVMSREQNATRSHNVQTYNNGKVQIFGKTLTNQISIQEEIKSRLKSGSACYHSVQNLLRSRLLSKNLKINPLPPNVIYIYIYVVPHS